MTTIITITIITTTIIIFYNQLFTIVNVTHNNNVGEYIRNSLFVFIGIIKSNIKSVHINL